MSEAHFNSSVPSDDKIIRINHSCTNYSDLIIPAVPKEVEFAYII